MIIYNIIKQLKHSDATLVDLLNDVKNKLEEIHVEEEKLQSEMQKETESLAKNGIKMNGKLSCLMSVPHDY